MTDEWRRFVVPDKRLVVVDSGGTAVSYSNSRNRRPEPNSGAFYGGEVYWTKADPVVVDSEYPLEDFRFVAASCPEAPPRLPSDKPLSYLKEAWKLLGSSKPENPERLGAAAWSAADGCPEGEAITGLGNYYRRNDLYSFRTLEYELLRVRRVGPERLADWPADGRPLTSLDNPERYPWERGSVSSRLRYLVSAALNPESQLFFMYRAYEGRGWRAAGKTIFKALTGMTPSKVLEHCRKVDGARVDPLQENKSLGLTLNMWTGYGHMPASAPGPLSRAALSDEAKRWFARAVRFEPCTRGLWVKTSNVEGFTAWMKAVFSATVCDSTKAARRHAAMWSARSDPFVVFTPRPGDTVAVTFLLDATSRPSRVFTGNLMSSHSWYEHGDAVSKYVMAAEHAITPRKNLLVTEAGEDFDADVSGPEWLRYFMGGCKW